MVVREDAEEVVIEVHNEGPAAIRLALDLLDVRDGDRLLVTGPNGAGKSTLLLVLAGRLEVAGVRRQPGLRVGLLDQDTSFANPRLTPRGTYGRALGAEYDADEELQGGAEIADRDRNRWELDPSSKDDFDEE